MKKLKKQSKTGVTIGDMVNWWEQNGHFNKKLYIKLSILKSREGFQK